MSPERCRGLPVSSVDPRVEIDVGGIGQCQWPVQVDLLCLVVGLFLSVEGNHRTGEDREACFKIFPTNQGVVHVHAWIHSRFHLTHSPFIACTLRKPRSNVRRRSVFVVASDVSRANRYPWEAKWRRLSAKLAASPANTPTLH
ncbi:hypothetical protein C0Q70_11476 [Pomacea canaliculata]|uniref:Uncharacterized protein n=1 Tax=Pomacea canaliculata TaxID=400727 RepID=A0A2T7P647_POMCA|nr:hypothetical protein C0Q70_11476 [Pomacea canaliculata]